VEKVEWLERMTSDFNIATAMGSILASAGTVESDEAVMNSKVQKY
jgi:hypothetical protein